VRWKHIHRNWLDRCPSHLNLQKRSNVPNCVWWHLFSLRHVDHRLIHSLWDVYASLVTPVQLADIGGVFAPCAQHRPIFAHEGWYHVCLVADRLAHAGGKRCDRTWLRPITIHHGDVLFCGEKSRIEKGWDAYQGRPLPDSLCRWARNVGQSWLARRDLSQEGRHELPWHQSYWDFEQSFLGGCWCKHQHGCQLLWCGCHCVQRVKCQLSHWSDQ